MKDLDLGQVLGGSALDAELLKALPDYQKGRESGLCAEEPPQSLNEVTRIRVLQQEESTFRTSLFEKGYQYKPFPPQEEPIPEKAAFRDGYFVGLREFLTQNNISFRDTGIFNFPEVLTSGSGLGGFISGLRRGKPDIPRDYTQIYRGDKFLDKFLYEEAESLQRFRFKLQQELNGYRLGFVVSIARDFGVKLQGMEIPTDDLFYQAFMTGLSAETREMPLRRDPRESKYYLVEESPHAAFKAIDENAYLSGLRVWLHSQGLGFIKSWQIRHPEALRAFKAALEGRVLSEYEPKEPTVRMPTLREDLKYIPRQDFKEKSYLPPSPVKEAIWKGATGYSLGKIARQFKQTLEVRGSTSLSPQ